jgi:ParB family chromosome partitioning protein
MPSRCRAAILADVDDAAAIEASMIENIARLDADEVTQWETFTRLVKEGRGVEDIAATFGLPDLTVRRVLALGNLLPRIRDLYAGTRSTGTVRHLTLATKSQQRTGWPCSTTPRRLLPTGHQLKAWLFGGQSIAASIACSISRRSRARSSPTCSARSAISPTRCFWAAQNEAIEARRAAYLERRLERCRGRAARRAFPVMGP